VVCARTAPPEISLLCVTLRTSYTLLAPFYDLAVGRALERARRESLLALPDDRAWNVLLDGVGTGLDLPWLPRIHSYIGIDLTRAMLRRARPRTAGRDVSLVEADSLCLPFADASFDCAVLHLIIAVVPEPAVCLSEAARVVRPGGTLLVLDKFLRRGQRAALRRAVSPIAGRIATRTDVVFEELLERAPQLRVIEDRGVLLGGWFRLLRLRRT
jgi:phosphatidylethanolamine/phosphatidyl-N-methylethanolamine N-methyltransferase